MACTPSFRKNACNDLADVYRRTVVNCVQLSNGCSAVFIRASQIDGTKFLRSAARNPLYIVTCAHCFDVGDADRWQVAFTYLDRKTGELKGGRATLLGYSEYTDLAILSIEAASVPRRPPAGVTLLDHRRLRTGAQVFQIGDLRLLDPFSFTAGHVREAYYSDRVAGDDDQPSLGMPSFVYAAEDGPGNSGGGTFDCETGHLCGLVAFGLNFQEAYGGATHPFTNKIVMPKLLRRALAHRKTSPAPYRLQVPWLNVLSTAVNAKDLKRMYSEYGEGVTSRDTALNGVLYKRKVIDEAETIVPQLKRDDLIRSVRRVGGRRRRYLLGGGDGVRGCVCLPFNFLPAMYDVGDVLSFEVSAIDGGRLTNAMVKVRSLPLPALPERYDNFGNYFDSSAVAH